ncbi:GNAT family N-acetyltransferase [Vibrio fluvialis]|nr:GNAT family N-acetyltransferase [Vibrio fluvialis]
MTHTSPTHIRAFARYFQFNNARTLSTDAPSELRVLNAGVYQAYIDPTRRYDNQLLIQAECSVSQLATALDLYANGPAPEISVAPAADSVTLENWMSDNGFQREFDHQFLQLRSQDYHSSDYHPVVRVERWTSTRADDFLALLKTSGLQCSDEIWQAKRHLYCSDAFRCFVAYQGDTPCAWATTYLDDDVATLANAFTQEAARGNGCQTALLHARIRDAIEHGAMLLLTDVMPESTSARNCLSVGFEPVVTRQVWCQSE